MTNTPQDPHTTAAAAALDAYGYDGLTSTTIDQHPNLVDDELRTAMEAVGLDHADDVDRIACLDVMGRLVDEWAS